MLIENFNSDVLNPASIFLSNLSGIITDFQIRNFFDILFISAMTYALLMLFIKTKSIPIIVGVFSMLLVYMLAVGLNLPLTQMVFKYFLGGFLIILIVIFQRELRRFFEMLGILGLRRNLFSHYEDNLEIITNSVWQMASAKTGALLVFPGRELIDRHLQGGFYLNGQISEPLLLSIFDKYSSGHDGAVIVEGNKIKKFAVHLPLTEKVGALKRYGTRHRSAVGLSEMTDALCLVVSEERGTVSIAHNRKLEVVDNNKELEKRLRDFFENITPQKKKHPLKLIKNNILPVLVSLSIALVFWGMFAEKDINVQKSFIVPVEFQNLSSGYVAEELSTQEVILTLTGENRDFSLFEPKMLKVSLDVSNLALGTHKMLIDKSFIGKLSGFSVVNIDPQSITFKLNEIKVDTKEGEEI